VIETWLEALQPAHLNFLLQGFRITLEVALITIALSYAIGIVIGATRYLGVPGLATLFTIAVETLRNLPILYLLIFVRFVLPTLGIRLDPFWSAVVGLTAFEAAIISEIVRAGLASVDRGQIEAATASGLTRLQILRYIALPQALVRMIPPTVSQFISLLKDTSLAVAISLPELMHNAQIIYNGDPVRYVLPILTTTAVLYFSVNFLLSQIAHVLERRLLRT